MTKYCKECGREEWGFLSALNEDGYCPTCAISHNDKKIKELKQELRLRIEENEALYNQLCKKSQQLKEANEVIKDYDGFAAELTSDGKGVCKYANSAHLYLEKWGVK